MKDSQTKSHEEHIKGKAKSFMEPKQENWAKELDRRMYAEFNELLHKIKRLFSKPAHNTRVAYPAKHEDIANPSISSTKDVELAKKQIRKLANTALKNIAKKKRAIRLKKKA